MSSKAFDFWIVLALLLVAAFAWSSLQLQALWGLSLFTLAPTAYLLLRRRKNYKKLAIATGVLGLGFGLIFDPIQVLNGAWTTRTVLPGSLFGLPIVVDDLVGYAVMTLFMLVFYEHFLDDERVRVPSTRWWQLGFLCAAVAVASLLIMGLNPSMLTLGHSYFKLGLIALLFPIAFLIARPNLVNKFAALSAFFFGVWLTAEYIAVSLGNWSYGPASLYVGQVSFFAVTFPVEELVLWMLCYAGVVVSYYEYFIDDGR